MEFFVGFLLLSTSLMLMALFSLGRAPASVERAMRSDLLAGTVITVITLLITIALMMIGHGADKLFRSAGFDAIIVVGSLLAMIPAYALIARLVGRKA